MRPNSIPARGMVEADHQFLSIIGGLNLWLFWDLGGRGQVAERSSSNFTNQIQSVSQFAPSPVCFLGGRSFLQQPVSCHLRKVPCVSHSASLLPLLGTRLKRRLPAAFCPGIVTTVAILRAGIHHSKFANQKLQAMPTTTTMLFLGKSSSSIK